MSDAELLGQLHEVPTERLHHDVYRATLVSRDPLVFSGNGGRWAPPVTSDHQPSILYTSFERDGALAEIVAYLLELTPPPSFRQLKVSRIHIAPLITARLVQTDLARLGVDMARFAERDYARTQAIGAALADLGVSALIAPSARYGGDNLMIFRPGQANTPEMSVHGHETIDWRVWARDQAGLLP